jgi:hypothetical protein
MYYRECKLLVSVSQVWRLLANDRSRSNDLSRRCGTSGWIERRLNLPSYLFPQFQSCVSQLLSGITGVSYVDR